MRTHEISRVFPVTRSDQNDLVVGWSFRLTLAERDQSAFADIRLEPEIEIPQPPGHPPHRVPTPNWVTRPLPGWRRWDVDRLIAWALAEHPGVQQLHQVLTSRLAIVEHRDFDIDGMPA